MGGKKQVDKEGAKRVEDWETVALYNGYGHTSP